MSVQGTMARRVADVRASFSVVAGAHHRDPLSVPALLTELGEGKQLRVAVLADPPGGLTHPGIADAVRSAAQVLAIEAATPAAVPIDPVR